MLLLLIVSPLMAMDDSSSDKDESSSNESLELQETSVNESPKILEAQALKREKLAYQKEKLELKRRTQKLKELKFLIKHKELLQHEGLMKYEGSMRSDALKNQKYVFEALVRVSTQQVCLKYIEELSSQEEEKMEQLIKFFQTEDEEHKKYAQEQNIVSQK